MRVMTATGVLTFLVLATLAAAPAQGAQPVAGSAADLGISFSMEEGGGRGGSTGDALLDAGRLVACWSSRTRARMTALPPVTLERRVGVRITSRSGRRGFARLRTYLETLDPRVLVSVDGVVLTTAPRLVDAQAPIGSTVSHRVDVEVPASEPPGAFASRIVWEVEEL
jgi:hypothetical protein